MFEKLENIYLDYLRYALLIFATLALIFTLFNLLTALIKASKSPDFIEVKSPIWSELRYEILAIEPVSNDKQQDIQSNNQPEVIQSKEIVDIDYEELLNLMLSVFNPENKIKSLEFTEFFSPTYYDYYLSDIPSFERTNFINNLKNFIEDLIQDQRVIRIGDQDLKLNVLKDSLYIYKFHYLKEQEKINSLNNSISAETLTINQEGSSQIVFSFYALGAFILILMYLLILKVEKNLRDIPKVLESIK